MANLEQGISRRNRLQNNNYDQEDGGQTNSDNNRSLERTAKTSMLHVTSVLYYLYVKQCSVVTDQSCSLCIITVTSMLNSVL